MRKLNPYIYRVLTFGDLLYMKQFDMCFNYLNNLSYIVQKLQLHVYEELYDEISTKFRHWINVRRHWIDVETMSEFNVESTSEFQRPFYFHIQPISTSFQRWRVTLFQRWNNVEMPAGEAMFLQDFFLFELIYFTTIDKQVLILMSFVF